ncbi:MAG: outer membrane beta-barrel protein [Bacteroidota bacterium]
MVIFTIGLSFFNKNETNTNGKTQVGTANFSNDLSDSEQLNTTPDYVKSQPVLENNAAIKPDKKLHPIQTIPANNSTVKNNFETRPKTSKDILRTVKKETSPPFAFSANNIKSGENAIIKNDLQPADKSLEKTVTKTNLKVLNIESIATLPISEFPVSKKIEPVNLSNKKINGGHTFFVSTKFSPIVKMHGADFGYLKNIKTFKNGLILQAGLSYSYINQPLSFTHEDGNGANAGSNGTNTLAPESLFDLGFSLENNIRVSTSSNNLSEQFINKSITSERLKLHYLSVPLQLNYSVNRFFFTGGIQLSTLLLTTNNDFDGGLFNSLNSDRTEMTEPSATDPTADDSNINKISDLDLSANVGIGYRLTKNMGIYLQYNNGFNDVIKDNNKKDKNRFFQLSVQYSWD